ncbi:XdhC family protein [Enterobacteriaceae bacterium H11S18]|uniref:XdhC family protein n=1 Tax=Dryocola clanedunensis TaxID=2925396 RepID=UPI0022F0CFF3|nr:XdhC family protein [Dryocola clanedunensis]MCT4713339.1 XdhC family protein [Dryocola clanedunensis]
MTLFQLAGQCEIRNQSFALIQLIESRGSTPRHSASMIVCEDGKMAGTIGGGMMERLVLEKARQALKDGESQLFHGRMAQQGEHAVGSDCGGAMTVHIAVYPRRPSLFLIGGGHVNRAIAQLAIPLNFEVHVVDTWQENLDHPALPESCHRRFGETFTGLIDSLPLDEDSLLIIATNHQDKESLTALSDRPSRFLGLLASRRKAQHFRQQLAKEGATEERIAHIRSPVGMDIGAETPEEIAISVMAELLLVTKGKKRKANISESLAEPEKKEMAVCAAI